jgi:hypothetical protein
MIKISAFEIKIVVCTCFPEVDFVKRVAVNLRLLIVQNFKVLIQCQFLSEFHETKSFNSEICLLRYQNVKLLFYFIINLVQLFVASIKTARKPKLKKYFFSKSKFQNKIIPIFDFIREIRLCLSNPELFSPRFDSLSFFLSLRRFFTFGNYQPFMRANKVKSLSQ